MLYITGDFTGIGAVFNHIAAYNDTNWINVGSINSPDAFALEVFNGELILGEYNGMRKYAGGTTWDNFPNEPLGCVYNLCVDTFNNFLYAGGNFYYLEDWTPSTGLAMWDGFKWNSFGNDLGGGLGVLSGMVIYRGDLYMTAGDTINGGLQVNRIARWNGYEWDSVGCGTNEDVTALEIFKDTLYVGGYFTEAGGMPAYGLAKVFVPDTGCGYIKPRVFTVSNLDTFDLSGGQVEVQFYNNNAYVDSWSWDFGDLGTANIKDPAHIYSDTGDYTVEVTVTHGSCVVTASKNIHVRYPVGVLDIEKLNYKLYPNPSDNHFYVELDLPEKQKCELRISGLNGHTKTVVPLKSDRIRVNTEGWSSGNYICSLFVDGKLEKSEKIILR